MDPLYRQSTGEILLYNPGSVTVTQNNFHGDISHYLHCKKRKSRLDPSSSVLDVRPPVLAFYERTLCILEGHTRHAYAHLYGVGLEGFVVTTEEDIEKLPPQCFETLSPDEIKRLLRLLPENVWRHSHTKVETTAQHLEKRLYTEYDVGFTPGFVLIWKIKNLF